MKEASFVVGTTAEVERARKAYSAHAWQKAYESFVSADRAEPLGAGDLELLARSAYMLGRDDDYEPSGAADTPVCRLTRPQKW